MHRAGATIRSVGVYAAAGVAAGTTLWLVGRRQDAQAFGLTGGSASPAQSGIAPIPCQDGTMVTPWSAPNRRAHMESLRSSDFDVLVVGGGCVGAGVALDASTRGLKVRRVAPTCCTRCCTQN